MNICKVIANIFKKFLKRDVNKEMRKFLETGNKPAGTGTVVNVKVPSRKSSRRLEDATPDLQAAYRLIRMYYRDVFPGKILVITESYRSLKKQQDLYAKGRTVKGKVVTYVDGIKTKGKHNYYPSRAIDVAVKDASTGKITWELKFYKPLLRLVAKVRKETGIKVVSGGSWRKLRDFPHLEV